MFLAVIRFNGLNGYNAIKWVSMSNQERKVRPTIVNTSSNKPSFHPYSVTINKCSGSCNDTENHSSKLSVPDVVNDLNIKVFDLMSRTNETCYTTWHETCGLDASVCSDKRHWNSDGCRC